MLRNEILLRRSRSTIMVVMFGMGLWIANKLDRSLIWINIIAGLHLTAAMAGLRYFKSVYPGVWWPIFGGIAVLFFQASAQCKAHDDREAKEAADAARKVAEGAAQAAHERARKSELDALVRHKGLTAGNLASLLKNLVEGERNGAAFRALQATFLAHAVGAVKEYLRLDRNDDRVTATWVVPINDYTQWQTVAYDRNRTDRQPGRKRDIAPGIPGAVEAFLTGESVFLEDTLATGIAKYFPLVPPYRSILSVPARSMSVQCGKNVDIDGEPNRVTGVLNIDCRDLGVLRADVGQVVGDVAYLLGLLEHLRGKDHV